MAELQSKFQNLNTNINTIQICCIQVSRSVNDLRSS